MSDAPAPPEAPFGPAEFQARTGASDAEMADLERYRALLGEWNTRMNLVGPSALAEFWRRHAYDSAQLLPLAPGAKRWTDLGAGAVRYVRSVFTYLANYPPGDPRDRNGR